MALRNLITDVAGVTVGHADDARLASGVTAIVFDEPAVASIDVRGGGTGTRESVLLDPSMTVERIDAIALAGGSAFGLEAAAGVMARLAEQGRGFAMRTARVPIVPGAILFDLLNGGDKAWDRFPPYREMGYAAAAAAGADFKLGTAGAGFGATTANFKGGVGSASATVGDITVGALVAVNARGLRDRRNGTMVLGRAVSSAMPSSAAAACRRRCQPARSPSAPKDARREHHAGGGRDRCDLEQGTGQAACDHGPGRHRARDTARAHPARRRPRCSRRRPAAGRCPIRSTASPSSAAPPPTYWPARWRARSMRPPHCRSRGPCRPGATGMEPRDNGSPGGSRCLDFDLLIGSLWSLAGHIKSAARGGSVVGLGESHASGHRRVRHRARYFCRDFWIPDRQQATDRGRAANRRAGGPGTRREPAFRPPQTVRTVTEAAPVALPAPTAIAPRRRTSAIETRRPSRSATLPR